MDGAAFEVGFEHGRVFLSWVAGHESLFKTRTNVEVGGGRE